MQKLYLVCAIQDAAFWSTGMLLDAVRPQLDQRNLVYNPWFAPFWQIWGHDHVMSQLKAYCLGQKNGAGNDYLNAVLSLTMSYLQQLDTDAATGKDILCFCGLPYSASVTLFFEKLVLFPHLKDCEPHALMLLGRQDSEMRTHQLRTWKSFSLAEISRIQLVENSRQHLDETHAVLSRHCGKNNCHVLTHNSADPHTAEPQLMEQLAAALSISDMLAPHAHYEICFPHSAPGLDMVRALYDFPFSFHGQQKWDRHEFHNILRQVELAEGFPEFRAVPHEERHALLKACEDGNTRLAAALGHEKLFSSPSPLDAAPDMPAELPEISVAQCSAFASAFPAAWRQAFLRHFRDVPRTLHPVEHKLAEAVERYRQKSQLPATYAWPRSTPPLAVMTLCWNHEPFIEQCMESVATQQCSIPYEHIIVDDCSDDNSVSLIDNFASRHSHVRPVYLSSRSAHGQNVHMLFSLCRSQYAALCDGDDYFTDPRKLQNQVDYLSKHPECSMCFHQVRVVYEDGSERERLYPPLEEMPRGVRPFYYLADLLKANFIQTNSAMYRWRFRNGLPDWFRSDLVPGDWYWHLLHAEMGKIGFSSDIMSVYRRHAKSLYYSAEDRASSIPHRLLHGLKELEVYDVINQHFEGRYERSLISFANNVLVDFLKYAHTTGDDKFLHEAGKRYPEFMAHFLKDVQIVRRNPPIN